MIITTEDTICKTSLSTVFYRAITNKVIQITLLMSH